MRNRYYQIDNYYPKLKNPQKYCGSVKVITLRSGWEITVANALDINPAVIQWSSEDFYIQYFKQTENRLARYFIDFYVKFKLKDGSTREELWEIKPLSQTKPPVPKTRKSKRFLEELKTYTDNQCKWKAAEEFCEKSRKQGKNIYFRIVTENDIFGKKK